MKRATTDLPVLRTGFPDQTMFSAYAAPHLATRLHDFATLDTAIIRKTIFATSGWRLTTTGCEMLSSLFKSYTSTNESNTIVTGRILLGMDTCCQGPWALRGKSVVIFDPVLHFELQLMSGKLNDFIDFKVPKKK